MSCDVAMAAYLILASAQPNAPPPQVKPAIAATVSVASEPLFADIIGRAGRLKAQVERYRQPALKASTTPARLEGFDSFRIEIGNLAALDMKGHEELARRGTDGDLKCILKGISQDLGVKLQLLSAATTGAAQDLALRDMSYLLRDNVEVITAPPAPPA
jgi:hypothetical protein